MSTSSLNPPSTTASCTRSGRHLPLQLQRRDVCTASSQPSSSSSPHPELLSADPFVSRFSHHRQLPASVISALTAPAPPLTPQPPIPNLKESVFSLHLSLLPAPSPPPPLPLPTSPPTLASLHIRPKLHPQWAVLTSRQSSATSTSTASSHLSSSSPSSTSSLTPTPTPSSSHSSTPVTHPVHRWLLPLLTSYTDLLWGGVGWGLRSATTQALALHVTNHVWKSRERVLRHNRKLSASATAVNHVAAAPTPRQHL